MHLQKLFLEQFRNYERLELDFDSACPVTFIIGENGQGKTNILEALYVLALTKSFRSVKNQEMIGWGKEYARVKAGFTAQAGYERDSAGSENSESGRENNGPHNAPSEDGISGLPNEQNGPYDTHKENAQPLELEIFLGSPPHPQKAQKKNGVKIPTADFIGNFQIVFFQPEDLNMLYLGPDLRRRYLDILNVQVNRRYFRALAAYKRILKQRNALLQLIREGKTGKSELAIWNGQLVEHGAVLMFERFQTIEFFQEKLQNVYRKISAGQEAIHLHYKHTLQRIFSSLQEIQEIYRASLAEAEAEDLRAGVTLVGPHRDDVEIYLREKPLHVHASRGEYRSVLLAFKLLELQFFEERSGGQKPLLLLDDVFSELDPNRQEMLLEAVKNHQTLITSAEEHAGITKATKVFPSFQVLRAAQGEVFPAVVQDIPSESSAGTGY